jgi:site-specific DNA-methyltransferase (adenine-specific)
MDGARLLLGDMRVRLRELPDASVDAVVTDPPYHLASIVKRFGSPTAAPINNADSKVGRWGPYHRTSSGFYGEQWDGGDVAFDAATWAEVLRVLKPGGHLVAFGAPRNYHRLAVAIEDSGFEVRDLLAWIYASGFPKNHRTARTMNAADAELWDGWGTALKPAVEPIALARKPLSEKSVPANVLRWRTGALNIAGTRVAATGDDAERWPSNVIHDGSDDALSGFPEDGGRYFFCAKASTEERGEDNPHPTVKPVAVLAWLVRLVTPPGGVVLDPFVGSGSTGIAAEMMQRPFIGIELKPEYLAIAERRMVDRAGLFASVSVDRGSEAAA